MTDGPHGGQVFTKQTGWQHYTAKVENAVDETGAGDAFVVGFVSARIRNQSIETATHWGKTNAAAVVHYFGGKAGLLTQEELFNS